MKGASGERDTCLTPALANLEPQTLSIPNDDPECDALITALEQHWLKPSAHPDR